MRHVFPPLAELTAQAQTLSSTGDLAGARAVLDRALDPADADPQRATADLVTAAALHARILVALGDPHAARTWAGFAHAAAERLYGAPDERTLGAAATHAAVLARLGNHGRAAQLYHDLVGELVVLDGPDSPRVLAAQADLATAEHAAGQCTAARARMTDAWTRHRRGYGDAELAGIKMLARLGGMERECGRAADAEQHLALAQELCARYLSGDHPLAVQLGTLAAAGPSGRHTCGRVQRSAGPPEEAPGVTPVPAQPYRPRRPGRPVAPRSAPDDQADDRPADPTGTGHQAPLYLSRVHRAPGDPTGPHAPADTALPLPGRRAPQSTPDGERVPPGSAPVDAGERLLPVPLESPQPAASRQPYLLAGVLIAGIGVAAAVVALTLVRGDRTPAPAAPASVPATAGATATPAAPAGAPTAVKLRDTRDSVALTWTYPKGAEGPVLISGSRAGQDPRVFEQLPPGAGDYVVYGLNERADYCFTVSVVYSTDRVAASSPVCTRRG